MTVDAMRKIDRWVGVPLCFLMSLVNRVYSFFSGRVSRPNTSRALFIELSEMGSAILVDPAMRKLRRDHGAELFFVIFKENYKSLDILKTIPAENIYTIRSKNLIHLATDTLRFAAWCRKKKITTVIDLELFSRFTALVGYLSGARARVGFASFHDEGLYRGNFINFPVRYNPHVHISVNFVSLVNTAMGLHNNPYATTPVSKDEVILEQAIIKPEATEAVRSKIKNLYPEWNDERVLLFNVNASDLLPQRRWPQENFAAVASKLLDEYSDILIVATGAPGEREYVQQTVEMVGNGRFINSAGVFSFDELVPLYNLSKLMLTNDSGPAHFAAVTPLKVFVLFGPETPALYGSLGNFEAIYLGLPCSPCVSAANHRKTSCETRPCITGILPEMVYRRLEIFLNAEVPVIS